MDERIIKIACWFACMHRQKHGYLLAFKKTDMATWDDEAYKYHCAIDVCATKQKIVGDCIQCTFYGAEHNIPFAVAIPYAEDTMNMLKDNKYKLFTFDIENEPQPFGRDMYRAKSN